MLSKVNSGLKRLLFVAVTFLCLGASGCATIIHGSSQDVIITSEPPGATVTLNAQNRGLTPLTATLNRKNDYVVMLKKDGFHPVTVKLERELSPWYLGNLIFGGLLGLVLDPLTGAWLTFNPDQVAARLTPVNLPDPARTKAPPPPRPAPAPASSRSGWQRVD